MTVENQDEIEEIEPDGPSLMDLSIEMIIHIFKYLNPSDRQMLGQCSSVLFEVSTLFLDDIKFHINGKYMASNEKTSIQEFLLDIRPYKNILISGIIVNDELMPYFEKFGPFMENICFCNTQFHVTLFDILEHTPQIKRLEIYSCESFGLLREDQNLVMNDLEKLTLQFNDQITESEFNDLVKILPNLVHFEFLHMQIQDDLENAMIEYLIGKGEQLKTMKILEYYLDDANLNRILVEGQGRFSLERFYVKESRLLNILEFLRSQCNSIVELDLTEYAHIDEVMMKCICDELKHLKHIKMYNSNASNEIVGILFRAMVNNRLTDIETLDLSYCRSLTSHVMLENLTGQAYPTLKELKIDNLNINDDALCLMILSFPNLQVLSIAFGFNLTDISMEAITNLTDLRYLKMTNCSQITGGIPSISKLQALRVLHLTEIPNMSDEQLAKCKFLNLKELHLVRCTFTDMGVDAITRNCPALEVLDLSMNDSITEKSVVMIGERLKRLTKLEMRCCKRVGDEITPIINEHFGRLKILNVYGTAGRKRQLFDHMFPNCLYLRIIEQ
uniref:CSON005015 protein n=1 Tax=Culicoides sonorensis TaxID=179676 RepID=A0A336K9V8_CULSO